MLDGTLNGCIADAEVIPEHSPRCGTVAIEVVSASLAAPSRAKARSQRNQEKPRLATFHRYLGASRTPPMKKRDNRHRFSRRHCSNGKKKPRLKPEQHADKSCGKPRRLSSEISRIAFCRTGHSPTTSKNSKKNFTISSPTCAASRIRIVRQSRSKPSSRTFSTSSSVPRRTLISPAHSSLVAKCHS